MHNLSVQIVIRKNDHGQLYFEDKVSNYLKNQSMLKFITKLKRFLEMKMMWFLLVIGSKQFPLDKTDDFEDFHVFIPNFQEFGFKDRIAKESDYKFSYREGFVKK